MLRRRERLRDLYVMDDVSKNEYLLRRQAIEEELDRIGAPFDPQFDEAEELLAKFADFWAIELSQAEQGASSPTSSTASTKTAAPSSP